LRWFIDGVDRGFVEVEVSTKFLNDEGQGGRRELDDKIQVVRGMPQ
jgi:hypothetical protein